MTNEQSNHHFDNDGHLRIEALDAIADGTMEAESATHAHLASCARCREHLAELQATIRLLQALPEPAPSRSFQIEVSPPMSAQEPTAVARDPGVVGRIRAVLIPALPVLRTATLGIFILFLTVSAGDLWTSRDQQERTPAVLTTEATMAPPPATTAPPDEEESSATDRPAESDEAADNASADQAPAPEPASGGAARDAESSELEAAPAAAQPQSTETGASTLQPDVMTEPSPAATKAVRTPTATAEAVGQVNSEPVAHNSEWSAWRIAQVLLLALLTVLLATLAWLRWGHRREI